jgi:hypothetical protein
MALTSFTAGEAISAGDTVFVSSTGFIYKSSAILQNQASAIGVALDSGSAGSLIRVNGDFLYTAASGLTPGEYRYVSILSSGVNVSYSTWSSDLAATAYEGAYLTTVGRAVSTSALEVELSRPTFVVNPTSVILLETSAGVLLDAMLQEDGSTIDLETA